MRIARAGLVAVVGAWLVLASGRPAESQNPGKVCTPFSQAIFNMCTGETILVTGEACMDVFPHFDASGGTHFRAHETITGTGVGLTSGNQYVFHTVINVEENLNSGNNAQDEATIITDAMLISKGSMPNERVTITSHATINANGTATSMHVDVTDNCNG
jgi:hypothetical protein